MQIRHMPPHCRIITASTRETDQYPVLQDVDLVEILRHVTDGKADFQLIDEPMYENYMKEYSLDLKSVKLSG